MKTWVLILTMPSGSLWVLGERENCLALFPVEKGQITYLKDVMGFDSEDEAIKWRDSTASMSEQGKKMMERVEPFEARKLFKQ